MGAPKDQPKEPISIETRREIVRHLRFGLELTYVAIVEKLKARGITTTRATVARDCEVLRREFAAFARNFDPLSAIGERAERFRLIAVRAMRASVKTNDDGHRAKLLRVATTATSAEVELLQTCGLLPRDLGVLRVQQGAAPSERPWTGEELQRRFAEVHVTEDDVTSDAERAFRQGDWAAADDGNPH